MKAYRKTKIICTLGPATDDPQVLRELMLEGMNAARFNFSHGTYEELLERLTAFTEMREQLKLPIATILDTKGPEIRLGTFKEGKVLLEQGQEFTLTTRDVEGDKSCVTVSYDGLPGDVSVGSRILIDDGLIELKVLSVADTDICCEVENGGVVSNRKGVNVPDVELSLPYLSEKDYTDIMFGVEHEFDFIAASFVRTAEDVYAVRKILVEHGCSATNIIAKIENRQGLDNIDDIIDAADGIMVARGDMGVEIPFEEVPAIQKMIIKKAYMAGKLVITATQMLDSMMKNPRPTRAEAADVANAIYDGTSAVMLSGETAAGNYPVEALKTMVKIAYCTEEDINYNSQYNRRRAVTEPDITSAISHATCTTAADLKARAIITVTKSGFTARMISKHRPECPIISCTTTLTACRQLNLSWGVVPLLIDKKHTAEELFDRAVNAAEEYGYVEDGDIVVMTAGIPLGVSGTTNMVKVVEV